MKNMIVTSALAIFILGGMLHIIEAEKIILIHMKEAHNANIERLQKKETFNEEVIYP